jgi:hypothetical protein
MSTYLDIAKQAEALLLTAAALSEPAREEQPPPPVETPPPAVQADAPARSYRQWVTGRVPQTATIPLAEPLPEPRYHDKPSPCKTYRGMPCTVKACKGNQTRFWPTRLCVACWTRSVKVTRMSETPE